MKFLLPLLLTLASAGLSFAANPAPFADGERVVFLGDSITRGGGWHSALALYYATRFPNQRNTWINAGISGDTAAGALDRLEWDVLSHKPDTVVIMFGMNEASRPDLPGPIGSDERVELYRKNVESLLERFKQAKVKVVLCAPSPYDSGVKLETAGKPEVAAALARISKAARELADKHGVGFVDFFTPMSKIGADFQKTNPAFTIIGKDRVHPGEMGSTVMASIFLQAQGVPNLVSETVIDAGSGQLVSFRNEEVADLKADAGEVSFTLTEKALPIPFEGEARKALHLSGENELEKALATMKKPTEAHTGDGWHSQPIQEALNRQILQVSNLPKGEYELLIDDVVAGRWWDEDLSKGINLVGVRSTPQYQQALKVSQLQSKRHQLEAAQRGVAFTKLYTLTPAGVNLDDKAAVQAVLDKLINDPKAEKNPALGAGGFAQGMAKSYFKTLEKEAETAATLAADTGEIYRLNQPTPHRYRLRPVGHPVSVEQRQAALASRHNPEQMEKTAREFLDLLVLDGPGLQRSNLKTRKGFQSVADLAKADKPVEALNAWRDYFFSKLRNPAQYGLSEKSCDPYAGLISEADRQTVIAKAEEIMQGKLAADASPMAPGAVWLPPSRQGFNSGANPWRPATFQPLAIAYMLTGERRFLDKWIDYIDDWAMHETADAAVRPTDLPDNTNAYGWQVPLLYKTLAGIARSPQGGSDFPADTLARILGKLIRVYPTAALIYFESNPQNWTSLTMVGLMQTALLMDEFKASEYLFNRARARHENYPVIQGLPDGAETEHSLWYNRHGFDSCSEALELAYDWRGSDIFNQRGGDINKRLSWAKVLADPSWDRRQRDLLVARSRYLLQMMTQLSQNPVGNRNDQRVFPGVRTGEEFDLFSMAPDLGRIVETLHGNTASGLPSFTMSAFPYSGSWMMRTGWGREDGYAHFFSSTFPSAGHALMGLKGNNGFYLSLAGQDLLTAGNFGNYSYDRSPVRVDGWEQFKHAGVAHSSGLKHHKGFGIAYIDPQPADWRSHSSGQFDFAEGVYSGPYGEFADDHHDKGAFSAEFLAERARGVITGISHQRQIFFIKDPGLWVVVDRLKSAEPHQYSLDWQLPVVPIRQFEGKRAPRFGGKSFTPETIAIDANGSQSVITAGAEMPNVAILHFGPRMEFSTQRNDGEAIKEDYTLNYKLYDFLRVSGSWKSTGNDLVISLIEAVPKGASPQVVSTEPLGDGKTTRGFKATLANGKSLSFMAALEGEAEMKVADVSAKAEALLVSSHAGGLVLGCEKFQGKKPAATDFEFALDKGKVRPGAAILTPIAPVKIEPACNVINGPQPVSLSCATGGVEIRYTLDGTEPNLQSALYAGPFTIDNTVTVKARAFRKGLERLPENLAGTHATVTASAYFTLQKPAEAVAPLGEPKATPGLKAEYYEGDWRDMVFFPQRVQPQKTLTVKNLFERCAPNAEKAFGWTYSGYLAVPEDGIYTFYAPQELILSKAEPGYALRLFVGQESSGNPPTGSLNEWYPSTTRHGYGTWSVALKKGLHPFKAIYVDYRTDAAERFNHPGMRENTIWGGTVPELLVSGPGLEKQPIPQEWFFQR